MNDPELIKLANEIKALRLELEVQRRTEQERMLEFIRLVLQQTDLVKDTITRAEIVKMHKRAFWERFVVSPYFPQIDKKSKTATITIPRENYLNFKKYDGMYCIAKY